MKRVVAIILFINLGIGVLLAFAYPHLIISPGQVIDGHAEIDRDCFACHSAFFGASSEKCAACHKPAEIGIKTSKGVPLAKKKNKTAFHQELTEADCVACHSDHLGVAVYRDRQDFSHALLNKAAQRQCASCHRQQAPQDALHRRASSECHQCHGTEKWKPATLDHDKLFVLDKHHKRCTTCHRTADYKTYTCYSCHEHSPENIRQEHWEEGIRDYESCVDCHRSTDEDAAKRAWKTIQREKPGAFMAPIEKPRRRDRRLWDRPFRGDDDDDDDDD